MAKYDKEIETLVQNEPGLTMHEIADRLSQQTGKVVTATSLRLGDLGLRGLLHSKREEKIVPERKVTTTYYAGPAVPETVPAAPDAPVV